MACRYSSGSEVNECMRCKPLAARSCTQNVPQLQRVCEWRMTCWMPAKLRRPSQGGLLMYNTQQPSPPAFVNVIEFFKLDPRACWMTQDIGYPCPYISTSPDLESCLMLWTLHNSVRRHTQTASSLAPSQALLSVDANFRAQIAQQRPRCI